LHNPETLLQLIV
jgi:hypothetical protein